MSMYGLNIKRLISVRQGSPQYEAGDSDSDGSGHSSRARSRGMRKQSWFTTRQPRDRKRSSTPMNLSRPQSLLQSVSSLFLPRPDETRRSSSSSLYSRNKRGSTSIAGTSRSTLCSVDSKHEGSELSLHISGATSVEGNDLSPLLKDNGKHLRLMNRQAESSGSKLDLVEALSMNPEDSTDRSRSDFSPSATAESLPYNTKQAIQEAESALEVFGDTLSEVDSTRTSFNETPRLPPSPNILQQTRRRSVEPKLKKKSPLSRAPTTISPTHSVRRNPSVKSVKRRKSTKKRPMKAHRKPPGAKHATKNNSKWTENVTDLLSGMLFQKIEADEMLTPAQIEAYKLQRLSRLQLQGATQSETSLSPGAETVPDTPVEPFHLDDLPSRIGSSGVKLTASTPVDERPEPRFSNEAPKKEVLISRGSNEDEPLLSPTPSSTAPSEISSPAGDEESPTRKEMISSPHIPVKSPSRSIFRNMPRLSTISETTSQDDEPALSEGSKTVSNSTGGAEYVFLRSTPYTMTNPRFRHGPIRLAKEDIRSEPKLRADENLDWTAFQMAILGGAGDYFTENEHLIRGQEAEDAGAICDWWEEWGFRGCGGLVEKDDRSRRSSAKPASSGDDGDHLYQEIRRDNPYSARHRWSSVRRKAAAEGRKLDLDLHRGSRGDRLYSGGGIKKWSADGHASRLLGRESLVSMPQSPMMELRVVTSENGDVDYVPMGFNLSHDLGDFLNWETENVYSDAALYNGGVI